MKNIRHMTLGEYKELVVPKVLELKKILRKKYLISDEYYGLKHLTKEEYIEKVVDSRRHWSNFDEDVERSGAESAWGLNNDPIPAEIYDGYKEIFDELSPLFIDYSKVELNKIHKDHKTEVRRAIDKDYYVNEIKSGELTFDELEAICGSVGVRIPNRVMELKEKVEMGIYSRGFVKANEAFLVTIKEFIQPYRNELIELKRDQLINWIDNFESQSKSLYDYYQKGKRTSDIYSELSMLYDAGGKVRNANFEKRLKDKCEDYASSYIDTFVMRIEDKLNLVNATWGIPNIKFHNDHSFSGGQLNVNFELIYDNGEVIKGESKVIVAGGYIQCLHQRYLMHFWHNGNNVSLEQMDQLI